MTEKQTRETQTSSISATDFASLGLAPELLRAISVQGYREPTPIQTQAIPPVLSGRDLMGGAQTGTGKTAAFVLPLLQQLLPLANSSPSPARHPLRVLILTPTRELAVQVHQSVRTYGHHTLLRSYCAYGGVDIKKQTEELKQGVEILVATPGRLLDHVEQKNVLLNQVSFLVLDEADRMLDMGFIPDIKRIIRMLPKDRQSLLFSATFSDEIKKLADSMLRTPLLIEVARHNTVSETIEHRTYAVEEGDKLALLIHLLHSSEISQCIIFVKTRIGCARLARELQRVGISADAIHGDKNQHERLRTLEAFKGTTTTVLVATDVAARGLDIDDLPHVINYELPSVPEDYVHRIGRTGRAGRAGKAISLVCPLEQPLLDNIEAMLKKPVERMPTPPFARNKRYRNTTTTNRLRPPVARPPMLAEDGFDFSKPYQPKESEPAGEIPDSPHVPPKVVLPKQPKRIVAALLGGIGKNNNVA